MVLNYIQIFALALMDTTSEFIFLIHNIFIVNEIQTMTAEAKWLNIFGKPTKRGVHMNRSRMVTFRIRYKYVKLAWYVPYSHCLYYYLVAYCFDANYGFIMVHILAS